MMMPYNTRRRRDRPWPRWSGVAESTRMLFQVCWTILSFMCMFYSLRQPTLFKRLKDIQRIAMTRRSISPSVSSSRPAKRQKVDHLTSESFKHGVMLAPMVRSGACKCSVLFSLFYGLKRPKVPTRLFALKYGAKLVWSPEIVDKAILHAERVVDRMSSA